MVLQNLHFVQQFSGLKHLQFQHQKHFKTLSPPVLLLTDELCFSVGERSVETPNPILDPDKLDPLNVNTRRSCSQQGFLEESCISPPLLTVHFILGYETPEVKEALSAP